MTNNWLKINHGKLKAVSKFSEKLFSVVKESADRSGFIFVSDHREQFKKHGFCARGTPSESNNLNRSLERMLSPFFVRCGSRNCPNKKWFKDNSAFFSRCYASRQRWVRTFDDAFLCSNTVMNKQPRSGRNSTSLMLTSLGGPIHPTAEGHSHIANAVWNKVKSMDFVKRHLENSKWKHSN